MKGWGRGGRRMWGLGPVGGMGKRREEYGGMGKRKEEDGGMGKRREEDAGMGKRREEDARGPRTTGSCVAAQPSLRKPGMSQLWDVFSPLRWASAGGQRGAQLQAGPARPPRRSPRPPGPLTLQAAGVKLEAALAAAGGSHDHLDALPLDARRGLGARSGGCRRVPAGRHAPAEHPRPGLAPNRARGREPPQPLTLLGHKLRRHSHLEGGEDGRVVAGHDVVGAAWMAGGGGWATVPGVPAIAGPPRVPPAAGSRSP